MTRRRGPRPSGPSGIVTLLTDFGLEDVYVATVKGVLLAINPRVRLVDLTHAVPPQDIRRAALLLEGAWRYFPRGTVHLAVVDPGVGGPRRPIAIEAGGHFFVGPDNGASRVLLRPSGGAWRGAVRPSVPSASRQPNVPRPGRLRPRRGLPLPRGPSDCFRARAEGPGAPGRVPAAAGRETSRGRGAAGGPVRQSADEPERAGTAGVSDARGPPNRRGKDPRPRGSVRRAPAAAARGRGRQLGTGRGVRAGRQRQPAAEDRAGRPRQLAGAGAGFDAGASVEVEAFSVEAAVFEAAPSVPAGVEAGVVAPSPLDFFSASIPFFRPSDG